MIRTAATILILGAFVACAEGSADFDKLEANPDAFYSSDHERFFAVFESQARVLAACEDLDDVRRFLALSPRLGGNAEVAEAFSEKLEGLAAENPRCFLAATATASPALAESLSRLLDHPLFRSREEIRTALLQGGSGAAENPVVLELLR